MFLSLGPGWSIEIINTRDTWCDGVYLVTSKGKVIAACGSEAEMLYMLAGWLLHDQEEPRIPRDMWSVSKFDAQSGTVVDVCLCKGSNIVSGAASPLKPGLLGRALRHEIEDLKTRK